MTQQGDVPPLGPPAKIITLEEMLRALPLPPDTSTKTVAPTAAAAAKMLLVRRKVHPSAVSASPIRRQPLMISKSSTEGGTRCAEMAGGTMAGCAAVVCCCPIGLVNLLVLATVRLPAGLCRRALLQKRRKQRGKKKKALPASRPLSFAGVDDEDFGVPKIAPMTPEYWPAKSPSAEVSEKEEEMWAQFYSAGFGRSPSQRGY